MRCTEYCICKNDKQRNQSAGNKMFSCTELYVGIQLQYEDYQRLFSVIAVHYFYKHRYGIYLICFNFKAS